MKYFTLTTLGVTVTALLLYAATQTMNPTPSINQIMTPEDQVRTGVNKLSPEERNELEEWLQSYAQSKSSKNAKKSSIKPSFGTLTINARGGQYLILLDGSVWEVSPDDIYTASAWLTSIPLEITYDATDPNNYYPYILKNQFSGLSVHARQSSIDEIPESVPTLVPADTFPAGEPGGASSPLDNEGGGNSTTTEKAPEGSSAIFSNPDPAPRSAPSVVRQQEYTPNQHMNPVPGSSNNSGSGGSSGSVPNFSVTTPTD